LRDHDAALRQWRLAVERARYEAERAERQYRAVEPENRLVARGLETEWEKRLRDLAAAEAELERRERQRPRALSEEEKKKILTLGSDLHKVWTAPTTTDRDRKELLRTLLEEVMVTVDRPERRAHLLVPFKSSYTKNHESNEKLLPVSKAELCRGRMLVSFFALFARHSHLFGQDKSDFPDGYDAVQAAPSSHRVLFENAFVRVLEVTVAPGTTEPMHQHRWPSIFLNWDTGGRTALLQYHRTDGSVQDIRSKETPISEGKWRVTWMEPEAMHSVENAETPESASQLPKRPPTLRVEIQGPSVGGRTTSGGDAPSLDVR
jgi:hypothetical protein